MKQTDAFLSAEPFSNDGLCDLEVVHGAHSIVEKDRSGDWKRNLIPSSSEAALKVFAKLPQLPLEEKYSHVPNFSYVESADVEVPEMTIIQSDLIGHICDDPYQVFDNMLQPSFSILGGCVSAVKSLEFQPCATHDEVRQNAMGSYQEMVVGGNIAGDSLSSVNTAPLSVPADAQLVEIAFSARGEVATGSALIDLVAMQSTVLEFREAIQCQHLTSNATAVQPMIEAVKSKGSQSFESSRVPIGIAQCKGSRRVETFDMQASMVAEIQREAHASVAIRPADTMYG